MTLVELLVVIAIIGILASLLLPTLAKGLKRGKQTACRSNLRQLGLALNAFAQDHSSRLPWEIPFSDGGASESNQVSPTVPAGTTFANGYAVHLQSFRVLSNLLGNPRILACPGTKQSATGNFRDLGYQHISYFLNPRAQALATPSVLAGDHNLLSGKVGNAMEYRWTQDRHDGRGQLVFGDGRVETFRRFSPTEPQAGVAETPAPSNPGPSPGPAPGPAPGTGPGTGVGGGSSPSAGTSTGATGGSGTGNGRTGGGAGDGQASTGDIIARQFEIRESRVAGPLAGPAAPRVPVSREFVPAPMVAVAPPAVTPPPPPIAGPVELPEPVVEAVKRSFWWVYLGLLFLILAGMFWHFWKTEQRRPEPVVLLESSEVMPPTVRPIDRVADVSNVSEALEMAKVVEVQKPMEMVQTAPVADVVKPETSGVPQPEPANVVDPRSTNRDPGNERRILKLGGSEKKG